MVVMFVVMFVLGKRNIINKFQIKASEGKDPEFAIIDMLQVCGYGAGVWT